MLKKIYIKNFAVIDSISVSFCKNLNILSGETGAGKSIILESLNFLFGKTKGIDVLRSGESEGFVSAVFEPDNNETNQKVALILQEAGINCEFGEDIIIKRDISSNGKSRFFINNEPVNKVVLSRLSDNLITIFGQNDKMFLTSSENQLSFLDEFADNQDLLKEIKDIYSKIKSLTVEKAAIRKTRDDSLRSRTINSYIISDFEGLGIKSPDEEPQLKSDLKRLENISSIKDFILSSIDLIDSEETGILKNINLLAANLQKLREIDPDFASGEEIDNTENAKILIEDILLALQKNEDFEIDEERMNEIKLKVDRLIGIEDKYRVSCLSDLFEVYEKAKSEFESESELEEKFNDIDAELSKLGKKFNDIALGLHKRRIEATPVLEKSIESELISLKIKPIFKIEIRLCNFNEEFFETGLDICTFMFSANPGEKVKPLYGVASGGELSRLSLCILKVIYSGAKNTGAGSTFIFDEIDSGIGGDVANFVGESLKSLASVNQVILITHLAQVASFADKHFSVYKDIKGGKTYTEIKELSPEERVYEIARMLSGDIESAASISHAREILKKRGQKI